jgi:hypothetical protein
VGNLMNSRPGLTRPLVLGILSLNFARLVADTCLEIVG